MTDRTPARVGDSSGMEQIATYGEKGFQRCDWFSGLHGALDFEIPFKDEKHILLVGYNKVFHGFLWMGGGKFSYDVTVSQNERILYGDRSFVRFNTREIAYTAYLKIKREEGELKMSVDQDISSANSRVVEFTNWLNEQLNQEKDAAAEVLGELGKQTETVEQVNPDI